MVLRNVARLKSPSLPAFHKSLLYAEEETRYADPKEEKTMEIKDKLKAKRQEAGLTQKELAEILHVSRQTVSSWEVGRTYPDLEILVAISELYETLWMTY